MQRQTGRVGEQLAKEYLQSLGMQPMDSNVCFKQGEVDLILRDGDTLVFCEVKARAYSAEKSALLVVTPAKQRRICACAVAYIARNGLMGRPVRFDVVAVDGYAEQSTITHLKAAFAFQAPRYFV